MKAGVFRTQVWIKRRKIETWLVFTPKNVFHLEIDMGEKHNGQKRETNERKLTKERGWGDAGNEREVPGWWVDSGIELRRDWQK